MKVCQILAGNEDGGLEKHTIELSKGLNLKDIDVTVIAHKDFEKYFKEVKFIPLDLSKGRSNVIILYKLFKILKDGNFDIIHTQANKATAMISKISSFLNAKVVSTLHSYKRNIKAFEKSDFVITVSNRIANNLKNKNQQTIYNGINSKELIDNKSDFFDKYKIPKDKFLVTSIGRLCDVKSVDTLIESLVDLDIFCIVIGEGENKKALEDLSKKLDVEEKIVFTGNIENNDVKNIINLSNLTVITSEKEGFSYVFAESLIYNTPVISTDVADIKDIIGEEHIFTYKDSKELAKKINYIKENYELYLNKYEKNFIYAHDNFLFDRMIDKTINIYKEVTNESTNN